MSYVFLYLASKIGREKSEASEGREEGEIWAREDNYIYISIL